MDNSIIVSGTDLEVVYQYLLVPKIFCYDDYIKWRIGKITYQDAG